jgi:hypothetical protein
MKEYSKPDQMTGKTTIMITDDQGTHQFVSIKDPLTGTETVTGAKSDGTQVLVVIMKDGSHTET